MDAWQQILTNLYKNGRVWVSKLGRDDWRRRMVESRDCDEPPLQIMSDVHEFNHWIRRATTTGSEKSKGFVIPPGKYNQDALLLLAPFPLATGEDARLSLQMGIVRMHDNRHMFFGYRFESPEVYDNHNFYHAQPIQGFGGGPKSSGCIVWYPHRYPTFALSANNAAELVAAALLSCWDQNMLISFSADTSAHIKAILNDFLNRIIVR